MTDEDLATLETLSAAATAGPWYYDDGITDGETGERGKPAVIQTGEAVDLADMDTGPLGYDVMDANGRLIAASRTAAPALIAEVRRLRGALGYSEHRVSMLRAELSEALDESRQALDALHARCDALEGAATTPPDTGWRPRPPTAAEVIAHHTAHGGVWLADGDPPPDGTGWLDIVYIEPGDDIRWMDGLGMWRPLTAEGDPAPWPEVTT